MTLPRIQALERLHFEWRLVRERAVEVPERVHTTAQTQEDLSCSDIGSNQVGVAFEPEESGWNEVHLAYNPSRIVEI